MRGVLFIGGEAPASNPGVLGSWDIAVSADSGLETAENWGVRSDWIVGDMDSLDSEARLTAYPANRVLRYPEDKDYTDTELGLKLLQDEGCDDIVIVGGGGGRLDHVMAIQSLFERPLFPCCWITGREQIFCLDKVRRPLLAHRLERNTLVSVFPVASGPWRIRSSGLKWPLEALHWETGSMGISNRALDGEFELEVTEGRFLVIVPLAIR